MPPPSAAGPQSPQRRGAQASLYIGTGPLEVALLEAISEVCERRPALQATLLVDALRAQVRLAPFRHANPPLFCQARRATMVRPNTLLL